MGKCSHICVPVTKSGKLSETCTCPMEMKLSANNATCETTTTVAPETTEAATTIVPTTTTTVETTKECLLSAVQMKNAKSTRSQATDSYKVGDQLQIECVDGYLVKGTTHVSANIECGADGSWSEGGEVVCSPCICSEKTCTKEVKGMFYCVCDGEACKRAAADSTSLPTKNITTLSSTSLVLVIVFTVAITSVCLLLSFKYCNFNSFNRTMKWRKLYDDDIPCEYQGDKRRSDHSTTSDYEMRSPKHEVKFTEQNTNSNTVYKSPSQEAYYFKALKVDGDSSAAEDFNQDRHAGQGSDRTTAGNHEER